MTTPKTTFNTPPEIYTAVGLMSGTSLDGIDAALVTTDGDAVIETGPALTVGYGDDLRAGLRRVLGAVDRGAPDVCEIERRLTLEHADAVGKLLTRAGLAAADVDVIGFHGHTVHHDPAHGVTVQLGDGRLLAARTGVKVACDFRSRDVAAGGEGAPLVPVFHAALARANADLALPVAVLNVGGVANVTWVGAGADDILAFDTGPGNAPLDDWVKARVGRAFDENGALAAAGTADERILATLLAHPYFARTPPKSLDRQDFRFDAMGALSPPDGAATITAFIVRAARRALDHFPAPPTAWIVTGGGRHNAAIMRGLRATLDADVRAADDLGWDGDALEAQAFAYLAVRTVRGLPITFPATTGAPQPLGGGVVFGPS